MTHDETLTGTPVLEMSAGEYRDFLDDAARQRLACRRRSSVTATWPASSTTATPMSGCLRP
jgi:hypothetical protein